MQADNDGSIAITVPVKAGSHKVGVTFLATNYRPTLDLIKQYERKSLENNSIPQLQYYPAIGLLRIQGPFGASSSGRLQKHAQGHDMPAGECRSGRTLREADPDDAGEARIPASRGFAGPRILDELL